jgi:hypothetical protein
MSGDLITEPVVISVDPGGTTGWSIMCVHPEALSVKDVPILSNIRHWAHGQISTENSLQGERKCVHTLLQIIEVWPGALVVIEDFILMKKSMGRELLSPVRITAALEYALQEIGWKNFTRQGREALTEANDDRMKRWGLYKRAGGQEHARDADRHSIVKLRKLSTRPGERAEFFPQLYNQRGIYKG